MDSIRRLLACACLALSAWAQTDRLEVEEGGGRFRIVAPAGVVVRETAESGLELLPASA